MEGDVKFQLGEDEASLTVWIGFDDFSAFDAKDDVIDGNPVFEGFCKRVIDDGKIACVNFLAYS